MSEASAAPVHDLSGTCWQFAFADRPPAKAATAADLAAAGLTLRPCTVPGNFELDLLAHGLIPDPFHGLNILGLRRYERTHVWYATRFRAAPAPAGWMSQLVFDGVDCCADIHLNGRLLGSCDNMLVEHAFDVDGRLQPENELLVHIRPAVEAAEAYPYPQAVAAMPLSWESLYVRKAPHMYGWDIMPRALSAGLWRPVRLVHRPPERIESLYLETLRIAPDAGRSQQRLQYALTLAGPPDGCEIAIEGRCGDSRFSAVQPVRFRAGSLAFDIAAPRLWWPRGYGAADLYDVTVELRRDGRVLDRRAFRHGVRTVALQRTSLTTAEGRGEFVFRVNGERIFCKGSNWVPLDAFHSRDLARLDRAFAMVTDLECNILRCWGGNVYESDRFFDLCDRHGILVWQDFAMACAVYPQDEAFQRRLRDEAVQVIRRLRQHPSLLLWAGDNECDCSWAFWLQRGDPNRNVATRATLPAALQQEDPLRPYLPSSPYMDAAAYAHLTAPAPGTAPQNIPEDHLWGPRDYYKSAFYRSAVCHFVSEIGYHACPDPDALRGFLTPERLWPYRDNPEWTLHSTNPTAGTEMFADPAYRVNLMVRQIRALFGDVPENLDDFAFASQAVQAEAKKYFIERFRAGKWRRTGIIWWNLLDGWPQLSDAIVGYFFDRKQAYWHIRQAQQHVAVIVREEDDGRLTLVAANDTRRDAALQVAVRDVDAGTVLFEGRAAAAANAATAVAPLRPPAGQRFLRLEWHGDAAGANHYLAGAPPFRLADYRRWLAAMPELRKTNPRPLTGHVAHGRAAGRVPVTPAGRRSS